MSLDRMLQVLLPQPGDDLRSWAQSLVAQLQFLLQQQANDTTMLSSQPATAPLYQDDGKTLVITDVGEYKLADGTVVVDATGLHVKDATGFDVINGPTIRIDTQHIEAAAIETAQLAAGAITEVKISDNAITAPKISAGAIVAGKIATNAIVAGDGVIGNAAIVDAMIANLNAAKINAGDIAAARMSTNIVTALTGKFATLSALAASLGVVSIQAGGALLTQGVTNYSSGTGLWAGETGGVYKFRIGNPAGARLDWDGSTIRIYDSLGAVGFQSGETTIAPNLVPGLLKWTHSGTNWVYTDHQNSPDRNLLVIPDAAPGLPSDSPNFALQAGTFTLTFYANLDSGTSVTMITDLYPDTLPESSFVVTPTRQFYVISWSSSHADLANCHLRFFRSSGAGQVIISTIKLTYGTRITPWIPHRGDNVSIDNKLSASNITTYMANATIGTAQIIDANITTAKIADANITTAKIADANITTAKIADANITTAKIADANITTAKIADANITTAKIGTAQVSTLTIAGNAVTVPVSANGTNSAQTASTDFGGSSVIVIASGRAGSSIGSIEIVVKRGNPVTGTLLASYVVTADADGTGGAGAITYMDSPGSGSFTYSVTISGGTSPSCNITALGCKR